MTPRQPDPRRVARIIRSVILRHIHTKRPRIIRIQAPYTSRELMRMPSIIILVLVDANHMPCSQDIPVYMFLVPVRTSLADIMSHEPEHKCALSTLSCCS